MKLERGSSCSKSSGTAQLRRQHISSYRMFFATVRPVYCRRLELTRQDIGLLTSSTMEFIRCLLRGFLPQRNGRDVAPHQMTNSTSLLSVCKSISLVLVMCSTVAVDSFTASSVQIWSLEKYHQSIASEWALNVYAPPGSGYACVEDYPRSELPDSYEPMMAFPGTMRPGKTPENMPFHDLPIGDDDPDPVPWPHFQQIEWHHRWSEPPHEHPGTMEDIIEQLGRWATPEQEASMRAGVRRDMRQREDLAESDKRETIITDDDDDDDEYEDKEEPVALGDGIFGKLGSDADRAATAAAVSPDVDTQAKDVDEIDDLFVDDDLDDFLLDLGLDSEPDDDVGVATTIEIEDDESPVDLTGEVATDFDIDDEDELVAPDLDDEDDLEGDVVNTVPLDDFGDSDSLDVEDIFDEGGFDYDSSDYDGGDGDMW